MGANYEKVKKMTNEPGLLFLAQVVDEQDQRLANLKAAVDACCGSPLTLHTAPPAAAAGIKKVDATPPEASPIASSDENKG